MVQADENLDTTQISIHRHLTEIGSQVFKEGQHFFSTSKERSPRSFKPGETMVGKISNLAGRKEDQ